MQSIEDHARAFRAQKCVKIRKIEFFLTAEHLDRYVDWSYMVLKAYIKVMLTGMGDKGRECSFFSLASMLKVGHESVQAFFASRDLMGPYPIQNWILSLYPEKALWVNSIGEMFT